MVLIRAVSSLLLSANTTGEFKAALPRSQTRYSKELGITKQSCCPHTGLCLYAQPGFPNGSVLAGLSLTEHPFPGATLPAAGCLYHSAGRVFGYTVQWCDPSVCSFPLLWGIRSTWDLLLQSSKRAVHPLPWRDIQTDHLGNVWSLISPKAQIPE